MYSKILKLSSLVVLFLIFVIEPNVANARPACDKTASTISGDINSSYLKNTKSVTYLREFRKYSKNNVLVFGSPVDHQVYFIHKCYWEVSVFSSFNDRLLLWNTFLVDSRGRVEFVVDFNGERSPISVWRQSQK